MSWGKEEVAPGYACIASVCKSTVLSKTRLMLSSVLAGEALPADVARTGIFF